MAIIDTNVDEFFNDDVAVNAIYTPNGGQPSSVSIIFDRPYFEAPQFGDVGFESREIFITVKSSDFEGCQQGDFVDIDDENSEYNGEEFYILEPQFDIGISRIKLSKDDPNES